MLCIFFLFFALFFLLIHQRNVSEEIVSKLPHTVHSLSITRESREWPAEYPRKNKYSGDDFFKLDVSTISRKLENAAEARSNVGVGSRSLSLSFSTLSVLLFFAPKHPSTPRRVQLRLRDYYHRVWSKQRDGQNGARVKMVFFSSFRIVINVRVPCVVLWFTQKLP